MSWAGVDLNALLLPDHLGNFLKQLFGLDPDGHSGITPDRMRPDLVCRVPPKACLFHRVDDCLTRLILNAAFAEFNGHLPIQSALEEFDAGGRLKTQPVDARSMLPDKTQVSGANDLKHYLAEERIDQVAFSFLKHLATYASGRSLTYSELNLLKKDELKLKADGYRMKNMIRYVINSPIFLEK